MFTEREVANAGGPPTADMVPRAVGSDGGPKIPSQEAGRRAAVGRMIVGRRSEKEGRVKTVIRRFMGTAAAALISLASASAQVADSRATFEAASVKSAGRVAPGSNSVLRGGPGSDDPSQISSASVTLMTLLTKAFAVRADQVAGPDWLASERYSVFARVPPGATKDQLSTMLRNLLVERFHLTLHHGTKYFPAYRLVVAAEGPKLKPSSSGADVATPGGTAPLSSFGRDKNGFLVLPPGAASAMTVGNGMNRWTYSATMAEFAERLGALVNSSNGAAIGEAVPRVIDGTGLAGRFDFTLEFAGTYRMPAFVPPAPTSAGDQPPVEASDPGPNIFTAVERQLGLKLEKRAPVALDLLIIDHVDRVPTEN